MLQQNIKILRTPGSQQAKSKRRMPFFFFFFFFSHTFTFQLLDKPWSQVSSLLPPGSCLQFLSRIRFSNPTARRFFHRMMLTHALALSASQFVHKKKSQRIYTSMHSSGLELTKLTYTRLEDNLIRHRGDRLGHVIGRRWWPGPSFFM